MSELGRLIYIIERDPIERIERLILDSGFLPDFVEVCIVDVEPCSVDAKFHYSTNRLARDIVGVSYRDECTIFRFHVAPAGIVHLVCERLVHITDVEESAALLPDAAQFILAVAVVELRLEHVDGLLVRVKLGVVDLGLLFRRFNNGRCGIHWFLLL